MSDMIFKKSEKIKDFGKLNKLYYGWPKSGKTTFASYQIDEEKRPPLFIATEDGHHALDVYVQRITSWEGFKKLVNILQKHMPQVRQQHSCFVIDLISDLDSMCANYISAQNNVEHLSDIGSMGKGFGLHKTEFQTQIRELMNVLPCTFIAHVVEKEMMWNGEKIKVQAPQLGKSALDFINGKVDLIGWFVPANSKKQYPEISFKNTVTSIAGSRYLQLARTWTINPNKGFDTYLDIQKVFYSETKSIEPDPEPDSSPAKEGVKESVKEKRKGAESTSPEISII